LGHALFIEKIVETSAKESLKWLRLNLHPVFPHGTDTVLIKRPHPAGFGHEQAVVEFGDAA
jgi:hypothetical protein